jgi:hypothetical protein
LVSAGDNQRQDAPDPLIPPELKPPKRRLLSAGLTLLD